MLTRIKSSLTLRIFLITCALMMAVCMATYGAIAYLTPISYTNLLEDELHRKTEALIAALAETDAEGCEKLLRDFSADTGALLRLTDENGRVIYDSLPAEAIAFEDYSENIAEASEDVIAIGGALFSASITWPAEEVTITENGGVSEGFAFEGGAQGTLMVVGGQRAVNQASEAMKRTLPYLMLLILLLSLLISCFYARYIAKPIAEISQIAERIAAQDFGARWMRRRTDEIGRLGESLNRLSENLSSALSELKNANARLQRDIDREREMEQQRTAFFSAASHELKTPVTILKGQLSGMLAQIGVYRDREKYLARALEVTGRMENLIQEILTISRIEAGSFALAADEINLSEAILHQLELDEELIAQKKIGVERRIAANVMLRGNANLISNALDNVLMNAILYSPVGAEIRIALENRRLIVENTGVSIPEDALARLFTPFYRIEQSRSRRSGGSGLGLYLVKCILELHGASCEMQNTDEGVAFAAYFPDKAAKADQSGIS